MCLTKLTFDSIIETLNEKGKTWQLIPQHKKTKVLKVQ